MELNSVDDLNALSEYHKIDRIIRIEKKIHRLSYAPVFLSTVLLLWAFWSMWSGNTTWSPIHLVFISIVIASVGNSNVQRTNLLKELFALKYGH